MLSGFLTTARDMSRRARATHLCSVLVHSFLLSIAMGQDAPNESSQPVGSPRLLQLSKEWRRTDIMDLSRDGRRMVVWQEPLFRNDIAVIDIASQKRLARWAIHSSPQIAAFTPDDNRVLFRDFPMKDGPDFRTRLGSWTGSDAQVICSGDPISGVYALRTIGSSLAIGYTVRPREKGSEPAFSI